MDEPICYYHPYPFPREKPRNLYKRLNNALLSDKKDDFLRLIEYPGFKYVRDKFEADKIFGYDAPKICTALLNDSKGVIKVEDVLEDGMTPLHLAAAMCAPKLTKYLLEKGDNVDVMCDFGSLNLKQATPIDIAVEAIETEIQSGVGFRRWTTQKSIFELLEYVCESRRRSLEVLRMLVRNTQNTMRVRQTFIKYAHKGQLVQLTALFLASPEVFSSSFSKLYCELNSSEKRTDVEEGLLLLLDVFAVVGHKLVAYIRVEDPRLDADCEQFKIAFLREVAQKKGVSSPDDYFLRFFKPVRPEADQLASHHLRYLPEESRNVEPFWGMILSFRIKRKDIDIDYINRMIPSLEPEDAALLNKAIENKLSSMSTLHNLFETVAEISKGGEKHHEHLHKGLPSPLGRNIELPVWFNIFPQGFPKCATILYKPG